jgi:DNA-binding NarL/FixJ family response regulator
MDIDMPVMDGIETTRIMQKKHSRIKVLALTMFEDYAHITSMLQSGASGYLLKTSDRPMLIDAICRVNMGENYFPQEITHSVMQQFLNKAPKKTAKTGGPEDLTLRQKEVLKLIAKGFTNPQIAEQLFISRRTVDAHRRNLLGKLGVKNTAGLVRHAVRLNLIEAL